MQNYFDIEIDATHRRQKWERAIVTASMARQADPRTGLTGLTRQATQVLAALGALLAPRVPTICSSCAAAQ